MQCRALPLSRGGITVEYVDDLQHIAEALYIGGNKGIIRICKKEWELLSLDQKAEIIIHETCHIVHDYKYPDNQDPHHGKHWRLLMRVSGIHTPRAEI